MDLVNTVMNVQAVVGVLVHLGKLTLKSRDEIPSPYLVGFGSKLSHYLIVCNAKKKMVTVLGKLVESKSTEARLCSGSASFHYVRNLSFLLNTRVGTLIVATIYLQLIQNSYMFRSFTVLQCSHQHCVQPVASDVEVVGYL